MMPAGRTRVGIVAHELPVRGRYGGVARYLEAFVPRMIARGVDVHVFAPATNDPVTLDAPIRQIGRRLLNPGDLVAAPDVELAFLAWLAEERPDVVHIHHLLRLSQRLPELCVQEGVPYVLHVHDVGQFCNQHHLVPNWTDRTCGGGVDRADCARCLFASGVQADDAPDVVDRWRDYGRYAIEHASDIIYVSGAIRTFFEEELGWRSRSSCVMPPALDWPTPAPSTSTPSSADAPTVFACLGHIVPVKGVDVALRAAQLVDAPFELRIHGELVESEPHYSTIRRLLAETPIASMAGPYEVSDLPLLLADVDWVVCASRFEASPLVVHEAAACGVPTIGARTGGVPEKVGAGGILFECGDPKSLAAAMRAAMEPGARERCVAHLSAPPDVNQQVDDVLERFGRLAPCEPPVRPRVSVVLPVHDAADDVHRCIQSMIDAGWNEADELIVVDNASGPAVQELLAALEGDVRVARNRRDVGGARAANQGFALAGAECVAIVRPDVTVSSGWLDALLEEAVASGAAIVGATLTDAHGATRPHHPWLSIAGFDAELPSGRCMLVDRTAVAAVGGFEEAYLGVCEDVDLVLKLRAAGDSAIVSDDVRVTVQHAREVPIGDAQARSIAAFGQRWSVHPELNEVSQTGWPL